MQDWIDHFPFTSWPRVSISYITDNFLRLSLLNSLVAPSSTPLRCVVLAPCSGCFNLSLPHSSPSTNSFLLWMSSYSKRQCPTCGLDFYFLTPVPHCGFGCAALCQWAGELKQGKGWALTHWSSELQTAASGPQWWLLHRNVLSLLSGWLAKGSLLWKHLFLPQSCWV